MAFHENDFNKTSRPTWHSQVKCLGVARWQNTPEMDSGSINLARTQSSCSLSALQQKEAFINGYHAGVSACPWISSPTCEVGLKAYTAGSRLQIFSFFAMPSPNTAHNLQFLVGLEHSVKVAGLHSCNCFDDSIKVLDRILIITVQSLNYCQI